MYANKLKGQLSIPSALQQTICCSLNDSCLAQEQTWLPLCNTHVCCWHSSSIPQLQPPLLPASLCPAPAPHLLCSGGDTQVSLQSPLEQETFPPLVRIFHIIIARARGPGLQPCFIFQNKNSIRIILTCLGLVHNFRFRKL